MGKLQDEGFDTVDANLRLGLPVDTRKYEDCHRVFRSLGIKTICLYTNNPEKIQSLKPMTKKTKALASIANERNISYLQTKVERLNHKTVLDTFVVPKPISNVSKFCISIVHTTWNEFY